MTNVYFELTREFNRLGPVAVFASGQAVVYYGLFEVLYGAAFRAMFRPKFQLVRTVSS